MQSVQDQKQTHLPAGKVFPLTELPGWLSKTLVVPPGRLGVVVGADGSARTFPVGRHKILSFGERLAGAGGKVLVGYIPVEPFHAQFETQHLLTGDEELIDAGLSARLSIGDPGRYLIEQVAPAGELNQVVVSLENSELKTGIADLARRYTAADLIHGLPTCFIADELQTRLSTALFNQGLKVDTLEVISFWRSDEQVRVAEKVQTLEERLQDLELQKRMAAADTQAQYDDFMHQLQPELGEELGVRPVAPTADGTVNAAARRPVGETLKQWVKPGKAPQPSEQRSLLGRLLSRKEIPQGDVKNTVRRPPRGWWIPRALWIAFLVLAPALVTWVLATSDRGFSRDITWGFVTGLWMMVVPILLNAIRLLIEKKEELVLSTWALPGAVRLEVLAKNDRARTDRLVRTQCGNELRRCGEMLADMVTRVYQAGDTDAALRLRTLKQKFQDGEQKVRQPDYGVPVYLETVTITDPAWDVMLDYEENLLLKGAGLSEAVHQAQSVQTAGSDGQVDPARIEQQLDDFIYTFERRNRVVKEVNGNQ
jgi:hypothetical protein